VRHCLVLVIVALAIPFGGAQPVRAGIITFETIPGFGTPVDGMAINTQFQAAFGVTFSVQGGGSPVIAEVGPPLTAFQGFNGLPDQPAPGQNNGSFFITDDALTGANPRPLIISYSNPVAAASGEILDIDGTEAWQVQALNALGQIIDVVNLTPNSPGAGDALSTPYSFNHASADIFSIRLQYTGGPGTIGWALDNVSSGFNPAGPAAVPEPSSLTLLAVGTFGWVAFNFIRKRRRSPAGSAERVATAREDKRKTKGVGSRIDTKRAEQAAAERPRD
jgi:hypothetical protein